MKTTQNTREQLLQDLIERMTCVTRNARTSCAIPFDGCTINKPQADILLHLSHQSCRTTVKDLATHLHVTSGAVTQLIDGLVEKGLVKRQEDSSDRRILNIVLTPHARDTICGFKKEYYRDMLPLFDALTDREITTLIDLFNKIHTHNGQEVKHT